MFTFTGPKKFISWTSGKTEMPDCFFTGTKQSGDTHRSTCPLLVIYLFSQSVLDFILRTC